MNTKVKIGGIPYIIKIVEDRNKICHNDKEEINQNLSGEIDYSKQSIRILKTSPEHELRSILHIIIYSIITEYGIRELIDDNENCLKSVINQLALGLAEVLESIGITKIAE